MQLKSFPNINIIDEFLLELFATLTWDQWLILATGPTAVLFTQSNGRYRPLRRYACILGLLGQVGWFYTLYINQQWGAFVSSFFYTMAWCIGLYNYWIKKENTNV